MRTRHIVVISILMALSVTEFAFVVLMPPTSSRQVVNESGNKYPLVVLYRGKPEGETSEWNTGVWPGWGFYEGNMQGKTVSRKLNWAANNVIVQKTCDVPCYVTQDQEKLSEAHGVVFEMVNHAKFYSNPNLPVKWPQRPYYSRPNDSVAVEQKWMMFHYEASSSYAHLTKNPSILEQFDFLITPEQDSEIPITLVCPWGRDRSAFLEMPPKNRHYLIADFSHAVENSRYAFFSQLREKIAIDAYLGPFRNKPLPPDQTEGSEQFDLSRKIDKMSEYKFILLTEGIIENDWLSPEWSQIFLAKSVPVYYGAPNIADFAPGHKSYIDARDFETPQDLADYLQYLSLNPDRYEEYFAWKNEGLSPLFEEHLNRCAHYAECRICKAILKADGVLLAN